jgi:hypothetical protein
MRLNKIPTNGQPINQAAACCTTGHLRLRICHASYCRIRTAKRGAERTIAAPHCQMHEAAASTTEVHSYIDMAHKHMNKLV